MELNSLLLLVAFRHAPQAEDFAAGFSRFQDIAGRMIAEADFRAASSAAVAAGHIHDPVVLPSGALHCHWRLEVTPAGADAVRALIDKHGLGVDALIALLKG